MAPRPMRGFLLLALAGVGLMIWKPGGIALVKDAEEEGSRLSLQQEVAKVARFWEQPHSVRLSHGGLSFGSVSQGKDTWQLSVSEDGHIDKAGAFVSQEDGNGVAYGVEYDSTKSGYSVADAAGLKLKRVAFSAASKAKDSSDADWALHVEGDNGRHFSAAGDKGSVVYDGSFGLEVPVADKLALRYAVDTKRRSEAKGVVPSWWRHSAGLSYASPAGKVTMHMHQPDPDVEDAPLEYAAGIEGDVRGPKVKGSPTYSLRAEREGGAPMSYAAKVNVKGPEGLTGGLSAAIRGGEPAVSAFGEYTTKRTVANGIQVGGDTKLVLSPPRQAGGQVLQVHPIGVTASADLNKLVPGVADAGSTLDVHARYKLGAERPAVSASAKLKAKRLDVAAEASVDDQGKASGKLKLGGTAGGVAAGYEAVASPGSKARHMAQVAWPAELKRGSARAFGRIMQSEADHGGRPRLQLGVQYDLNADVSERTVRVQGESAVYDSGSTLLGEDGLAWRDTRLNRIRQSAAVLRKRIEGPGIESHKWLHR